MRVAGLAVATAVLVGLASPAAASPAHVDRSRTGPLIVVAARGRGLDGVIGGPGRRTRRWRIARSQETWAFRLSPDAREVAFYGGVHHPGVYVADRFGRGARRIASFGTDPVWSPDGARLAFWAWSGSAFPGGPGSYKQIFVADLKTGRVRSLPGAHGFELDWSHDGKFLAFVSSRGLAIVRATGGRSHLVYRPSPSRVEIVSVAWSPDDRSFALGLLDLYADEFDAPPPGPDTLARIGVNIARRDGSGLTRIVAGDRNASVLPVGWSPDGRAVTIECGNSLSPPLGICSVDTRTRQRRRLLSLSAVEVPQSWDWLSVSLSRA